MPIFDPAHPEFVSSAFDSVEADGRSPLLR
jgi:hypothetical protein